MAPAQHPTGDRAAEDAAWLELMGSSGETMSASPVYRMRLSGPTPGGLSGIPKDNRPADLARGASILGGHWRFGASVVETPPDHAPWGPQFPSLHFGDRIHRFHWLRDLAAHGARGEARGRQLAVSWAEAFGKWDGFAWRLGVTADRVINLLSAGPWLLNGLEGEARSLVLETLARQARHLHAMGAEASDPQARFRIGIALTLTGAAMDEPKQMDAGLALLEKECGAQILADGGHISRSPEALADALLDIQTVEELLLRVGVNAPAFLTRLQPRMAAMLSFFTLPDGGLLAVNGGSDGGTGVALAALRPHGGLNAKFSFARLSAFQRVQAEELTLYLDAGEGPPRPYGTRAHAGALAITVDDGPDRLITGCAANADLEPLLKEAARRTAAHSVMCLTDEDSAVFVSDPATGLRSPEGPAQVSVRRMEEGDQHLLEGQHGGWRVRHGVIYRRRLYVANNGARITGEDSLSRPMGESAPVGLGKIPYEIRFHLHPDVQIARGPDDKTVFLGLPQRQRVWRFRSEPLLSVETSRYWGAGAARKTQQLVLRGEADPGADGSQLPNRVRWALSRIEPSV
jgi:uncharacterized heparinase superfamily protein